jgi:beta-galactosidase
MTAKRETVGAAAKLALTVDRKELSADGEDVAMFAVEVQDAQGRYVPIADDQVSFRVSGQGAVAGTGNGDPTNHESDKSSSRKAFSGLCMALVQSTKTAGDITVEASAPGLAPASVTISSKAVKLRPQVAAWDREVPAGSGITGLWRAVAEGPGGRVTPVFTFRQDGNVLSGTVEGSFGRGGGGETPVTIQDGKVDGANVSFSAAGASYAGTLKGEVIELQRTPGPMEGRRRRPPVEPTGPRPAIGPPPDGSDPSFGGGGGRGPQGPTPIVLHRAKR